MKKIKYGLVLSGGGIRGVAHVGALKALEEYGIEASIVSGSSVGALVGAFYSAGYHWKQIRSFFSDTSLFKMRNYAFRKPGLIDTDKFYDTLLKFFPEDSFESLEKKFYVSATDLIKGKTKYFHEGPLIRPVLASAAFPLVFSPVKIEESIFGDGGISNNFPIEPIVAECDQIIGINVHPLKEIAVKDLKSSFSILERVFSIGRMNSSIEKFNDCDILINPQSLSNYGNFSMSSKEAIFDIGYQEAIKALESSHLSKVIQSVQHQL